MGTLKGDPIHVLHDNADALLAKGNVHAPLDARPRRRDQLWVVDIQEILAWRKFVEHHAPSVARATGPYRPSRQGMADARRSRNAGTSLDGAHSIDGEFTPRIQYWPTVFPQSRDAESTTPLQEHSVRASGLDLDHGRDVASGTHHAHGSDFATRWQENSPLIIGHGVRRVQQRGWRIRAMNQGDRGTRQWSPSRRVMNDKASAIVHGRPEVRCHFRDCSCILVQCFRTVLGS